MADATAPSVDDSMLAAAATPRRTTVVTPTSASRFDAPLPLLAPAECDLEQLTTACTARRGCCCAIASTCASPTTSTAAT